jgi:membrane protein implicated in regulation of membrane protease activity
LRSGFFQSDGRIDRLLSWCAFCAVLYGVFALAERRFWRAGLVALLFLVIVPWLGRKWLNRAK